MALLNAATHYIGNRHSGYDDFIHAFLNSFKPWRIKDHNHIRELTVFIRRCCVRFHGHCLFNRNLCNGNFCLNILCISKSGHKVRICRRQIMLCGIKTFDFLFSGNTQADCFLDYCENNSHGNGCPCGNGNYAKQLQAELLCSASVKQTVLRVKQANGNRAPHTVYTMHRNSTNGIINLKLNINKFYCNNN